MSYPSISAVLSERKIDLQVAEDSVLCDAVWEALQRDLGAGVEYLRGMVSELTEAVVVHGRRRILHVVPASSPVAPQLDRLLGADISRRICEEKLGMAIGKYNCHSPVVALSREDLQMSFREQIELQNGVLASADC